MMADCERALGRPDRALTLARNPAVANFSPDQKAEMTIVEAGARRDLGETDAALRTLENAPLRSKSREPWVVRLRYTYADTLHTAGRTPEAIEWFHRTLAIDTDQITDADQRIHQLENPLSTPRRRPRSRPSPSGPAGPDPVPRRARGGPVHRRAGVSSTGAARGDARRGGGPMVTRRPSADRGRRRQHGRLRGRVSSAPTERELPSGALITTLRVSIPRARTPMTAGPAELGLGGLHRMGLAHPAHRRCLEGRRPGRGDRRAPTTVLPRRGERRHPARGGGAQRPRRPSARESAGG